MNILKRYTKGITLSLLTTATLTLTTPAALAAEQSAVPENIVQAVKLPPLPVLGQKVVGISQKIGLDPQTQMMALLFLSQFGFPEFPGVSATEGLTLFMLADEGEEESGLKFVVFSKIEQSSPLRQLLTGSYGLLIEDRDGWALVALEPTALAAVKDFSALAAIASDKAHFDIETRTYNSKAVHQWVKKAVDAKLEDEGADEAAVTHVNGWVHLGLKLLQNYEWGGYGISVSPEAISVGLVAAPKAGTPDAKFINTPVAAAKEPAGDFLAGGALAGYVGQVDVPASLEYFNSLLPLVDEVPNADVAVLVRDLLNAYLANLKLSGGSVAGALTDFDPASGQINSVAVETGKYEQASVDKLYDELFNKFVPGVFALIADLSGNDEVKDSLNASLKETQFKPAAEKIGEYSVSVLSYSSPDPKDESKTKVQQTFITVVNGSVLTTSSLDSLKELVAIRKAGKAVANNLTAAYPLAPNVWFKGAFDLGAFSKVIGQILHAEDDGVDLELFNKIAALKLDALHLDVSAQSGHIVYSANTSLESIVKLVQTVVSHESTVAEEVEVIEVQAVPAN